MAPRWTHVVLKVAELDRSIAFYRRFCALEVVRDGRPAGHTVWLAPAALPVRGEAGSPRAAGDLPSFVLVLYQTRIDCRIDHVGFQCDARADIDGIAAQGERLGILAEPPFDGGGDIGYVTMLRDPDGHLVEFTFGQPIAGLGG
jgi:catechol 2,3-dioxygenase-like lactoylglutathione lyase family enzyme